MKPVNARIQNYRSITDSGWFPVHPLTAIVGVNEAGKSNVLQALESFSTQSRFLWETDAPRSHDEDPGDNDDVVTIQFELEEHDYKLLEEAGYKPSKGARLTITKKWGGKKLWSLPNNKAVNKKELDNKLADKLILKLNQTRRSAKKYLDKLKNKKERDRLAKKISERKPSNATADQFEKHVQKQTEAIIEIADLCDMSDKKKAHFKSRASSFLDDIVHCFKYPEAPPEVYKVLSKSVPKFLYFSDFADINGNVNLRKYIEFQDNPEEVELNSLEQEDLQHKYKTLKNLFSLLRVNPENVLESGSVRRSAIEERLRKRAHELICPGWTQKIAIRLRFDGEQAMVLVSDIYDGQTVNETLLAQRSKGFRTFFSFFINCGANNSGDLDNSTLLLDEPGLHLHADQQGKFLDILEAKSRTHTVLYSSHSPWMLPEDALNGILAVEKSQDKGTQVVSDWWARSRDSSQTIRKALGITRRDNIAFPGRQYIVAVEGPSDVIYLETMANALRKKDKTYVDKLAFAFQAAGGSGQLPARVASARQEAYEDVLLLVDSDTAGRKAKNQVLKKGILDVNKVLEVSEISGNPKKDAEIEDLIPSKEFTKVTNDYMTKVMNVPNREKITAKEVAEYKKSHRNAGNWETHEALVKKRKAKNSTYSKVSIAEHFAHMYISGALVFSDLMLKPFISLIEFFSSAVEH